jgi:starvation-inducible DNA-binding protein
MNYLGFDQNNLSDTVKNLNQLLADYQVYYQNLRNFHWNVQGENFFDLHAQFEELYTDARTKIDEIAERILTLRSRPISTLTDYLEISNVSEARMVTKDHEMVMTILENHKVLIGCMRKVISAAGDANDDGTIDMAGGFLSGLEKKSWMLDAWATRKTTMAMA